MTTSPGALYRSAARLGPEKTDALVLMCSDRRYRAPSEDFLQAHLGLHNYDIVAVPGGAYILSFAEALPKNLKVGMRMLKFLMDNHLPPRIVLIAHQDCARYQQGFISWLRKPGFSLEQQQKRDLREVGAELRQAFEWAGIEAYFARQVEGDSVEFEAV
ncbi:MAG TPA: carbonic anhydrase [Dehalococcoidia bacterium]|nr:carbonic anhydrase [Dehalococcoidia bacterium]